MKIKEIEKGSAYTGKLPMGCRYCREGSKMVLLVTGKCRGNCWYCPLSEEKKGKKVLFADEKRCFSEDEVIEEAEMIDARGTGITGGDPLLSDKTFDYIALLKSEFGEDHHIHLYTQSTDIDKLREVCQLGLDEIRFHPPAALWGDIDETEYPYIIEELNELNMDVGIEIPAIPSLKDETRRMLGKLEKTVDFVNLNELEFSATNWKPLTDRGYKKKSDISSAVKGSSEFAREILNDNFTVPIHLCTSAFKDGIQMKNRIKRRAENVVKPGEIITEEGLLIKGIIMTDQGEKLVDELMGRYDIPEDMIWFNFFKERVECYLPILEEIHSDLEQECYGIEEYPTADRLEVERWPLDG